MSNLIQAASTIASLAFTAFFVDGSGKVSQPLADETINGIKVLRKAVWNRIRDIPEGETLKTAVNARGFLEPKEVQPIIRALAYAMQADTQFANQIGQLADNVSQSSGVSQLLGQNVQSVSGGVGNQINSPTAPVFTGAISGSTITINQNLSASDKHIEDSDSGSNIFNTSIQRLALFQRLVTLSTSQFEQVVFALNPPTGNIPSTQSPQGDRVRALLNWATSNGSNLEIVEKVCNQLLQSEENLPTKSIEYYTNPTKETLRSSEARQLEQMLRESNISASELSSGCLALRKEAGLNLVFWQIDWIYQLAVVADGSQPISRLHNVQPTGRMETCDWMIKRLKSNLPLSQSCWIALTLGSLGVFIPEMIVPLTYILFNEQCHSKVRDEALVYLCLIGSATTASQLVEAADASASHEESYFHSRAFFGLLLIDNVDITAGQILKVPPYALLAGYTYGLAGSRNPRGRKILQQMANHSQPNIKTAAITALNKRWY